MSGNWKGSNTSEQNSTGFNSSTPDAKAYQAYSDLLSRAAGVASTPYQGFGGEEVAPINQQQQAGIAGINQGANFGSQYYTDAGGIIRNAAGPLDVNQFQNPYTDQVVNATQADFDRQNARAQSQVTGNAGAQGALSGNRVGVAQALTAEGNARAQAPIIAGLRSSGYRDAVNQAMADAQRRAGTGVQLGQVGGAGQASALQGAQAQFGVGTAEQQTKQAQDTQARMDYFQQQGYDFQTAQWLAGITTGVGSQMGGTGYNTGQAKTEGPTPSMLTQLAGLGIAGIGALTPGAPRAARGGRIISGFAPPRRNRAAGGYSGPWAGSDSWVPGGAPVHGKGAPAPPALHFLPVPKDDATGHMPSNDQMRAAGTGIGNWWNGRSGDAGQSNSVGTGGFNYLDAGADAGNFDVAGTGGLYNRGGRVRRGFAGGSSVWDEGADPYLYDNVPTMGGVGASSPAASFDDRFDASYPNLKRIEPQEERVPLPRERPEDLGVINPGEPHRLADQAATQDWRDSVDRDHGGQPPPAPDAGPPPPEAGFWPPTPEDAPDRAMAFANEPPVPAGVQAIKRADRSGSPNAQPTAGVGPGPPQDIAPPLQREKSFLESLGIEMTPSLRQGLMQAGLAMMATRRGGPGSFLGGIGEGGMAGVAAYNQSENLAHREAVEQQKIARDDYWKGMPYTNMTAAQKAANKRAAEEKKFGWQENDDGTLSPVKGGPQDPNYIQEQAQAKLSGGLNDSAVEVMARQGASGDQSWSKNIGRGAQGGRDIARVRNRMAEILTQEQGKSPQDAAKFVTDANREIAANQIAANAGARTRATRIANLDMILEVADAAVPAALEASREVSRTKWVPLNTIIQKGRILSSDPAQIKFGIANLQLAEGWARAMNPTGVMRESDRDKALEFLSTATSASTYEAAVNQIQTQIRREKTAISHGHSPADFQKQEGEIPDPRAIARLNSDPKKYRADFEAKYKTSADRFLD